jgi:hypothetical protein
MAAIIIPAEYESVAGKYYDNATDINDARLIHMRWRWNVRNIGDGPGWVDFWVELKRNKGWMEGGFSSRDVGWVVYEPGREPPHGLQFFTNFLDEPEQKEFAGLSRGVKVKPGFQGRQIPKGGEWYEVEGQLTIPGPSFSTAARTFWDRRLGKAYGFRKPAQKFHLTVKLIGLDKPDSAFDGSYAKVLGEYRWGDLFEVEYA